MTFSDDVPIEPHGASDHEQLRAEVVATFGGIGAISPNIYEQMLRSLAARCGFKCDARFREQVSEILSELPCPLD